MKNTEKYIFIGLFVLLLVLSIFFPEILIIWDKILLITSAILYHALRTDAKFKTAMIDNNYESTSVVGTEIITGEEDDEDEDKIGFIK